MAWSRPKAKDQEEIEASRCGRTPSAEPRPAVGSVIAKAYVFRNAEAKAAAVNTGDYTARIREVDILTEQMANLFARETYGPTAVVRV